MKLDQLEFGSFWEIEPKILEIIINEGVELRREHIERIEEGVLEKFSDKYALLINRVNSYSHTHDSMLRVAKMKNLTALAIVVYSDKAQHAAMVHRIYQDNIRVFDDKEEALSWLRETLI